MRRNLHATSVIVSSIFLIMVSSERLLGIGEPNVAHLRENGATMALMTPNRCAAKGTTDAVKILNEQVANDLDMQEMLREARLNSKIAAMIYDARTHANLTQAQLAKKIGTKQPVIARLDDEDYGGHSLIMLHRIAEALNLGIEVEFLPMARARSKRAADK